MLRSTDETPTRSCTSAAATHGLVGAAAVQGWTRTASCLAKQALCRWCQVPCPALPGLYGNCWGGREESLFVSLANYCGHGGGLGGGYGGTGRWCLILFEGEREREGGVLLGLINLGICFGGAGGAFGLNLGWALGVNWTWTWVSLFVWRPFSNLFFWCPHIKHFCCCPQGRWDLWLIVHGSGFACQHVNDLCTTLRPGQI
jgi:hypothetical protein